MSKSILVIFIEIVNNKNYKNSNKKNHLKFDPDECEIFNVSEIKPNEMNKNYVNIYLKCK